jgi:hypothetical protein
MSLVHSRPVKIASAMSKHLEPFKDIMRDTSHFKTGRSRLVDCSAAGQLFEDEGRFRSIPGRFIVASAGSETRGNSDCAIEGEIRGWVEGGNGMELWIELDPRDI